MKPATISNNLLFSMLAMVNTIPILPTTTRKGKNQDRLPDYTRRAKDKKRKKKKIAITPGAHFKPVSLFFYAGKPMSPAMYRHLHLGIKNPRKKNGSKSPN